MQNRGAPAEWWLIAAIAVGLFLLLFFALVIRWAPPEGGWILALFGSNGIVGTFLQLGTLIGAAVTVRYVIHDARVKDRSQRLTEYGQAVAMIASERQASVIAGAHQLRRMAIDFPEDFLMDVLRVLWSALVDRSGEVYRAVQNATARGGLEEDLEYSTPAELRLFTALGGIRPAGARGWPTDENVPAERHGRYFVGRFVLCGLNVSGPHNFSDLDFGGIVLCDVTFVGNMFTACTFRVLVLGKVTFRHCDMRGCTIVAIDQAGHPVDARSDLVAFETCQIEGATINGAPVSGTDAPDETAYPLMPGKFH